MAVKGRRSIRRSAVAIFLIAALGVVGVGVAWACTPQDYGGPPESGSQSEPASSPSSPASVQTAPPPSTSTPSPAAPSARAAPSPSVPSPTQVVGQGGVQVQRLPSGAGQTPRAVVPRRAGQAGGENSSNSVQAADTGQRSGATRRGGRDVFAGSLAPAESKGGSEKGPSRSSRDPSVRAGTADLWSGFLSASLVPSGPDPAAPAAGPGNSQLAVGIGLLGLLVALSGGFAVAASLRRRRAPARS